MFDDLLKTIKKLEQTKTISIPLESDERGYIDRQCPVEDCSFIFKVYEDDWKNICKDEAIFCPFCRHSAPTDNWFTLEQISSAEKEALKLMENQIHNAMLFDAQKVNRKQSKNSFI